MDPNALRETKRAVWPSAGLPMASWRSGGPGGGTAVKERPILMSGPMVRAILDERKTQTRRLVKLGHPGTFGQSDTRGFDWTFRGTRRGGLIGGGSSCWQDLRHAQLLNLCPYGAVGTRLWVRESFYRWTGLNYVAEGWTASPDGDAYRSIRYRADWEPRDPWEISISLPKPSIHMPRWASRLTLEITGVRIERLQSISGDDALSEGIREFRCGLDRIPVWDVDAPSPASGDSARSAFRFLWCSVYGTV